MSLSPYILVDISVFFIYSSFAFSESYIHSPDYLNSYPHDYEQVNMDD